MRIAGKVVEAGEPLDVRVRPKKLDEVIGQDAVVKALKRRDPSTKAFLFHGPAGVGKTTLGRIIAQGELIEVDGARYSTVEEARNLAQTVQNASILDPTGKRTVLMDECHRLSGNAWDALLKIVEEPPPHLYWVFCTTNVSKVPKTILTRCQSYALEPVSSQVIAEHLEKIANQNGMRISLQILKMAAEKADGSVRQAIKYLMDLDGVKDRDEALRLMRVAEDRDDVIDFLKYLCFDQNRTWQGTMEKLKDLKEQEVDAESIRIVAVNWVGACAANAKNPGKLLHILGCFSGPPFNPSEKYGPLILALGNAILTQPPRGE